jgi:hypothetical protein
MKHLKNLNSLRSLLLSICLLVFVMTLTGCGATQSETSPERNRRRRMILQSNLDQMADDVDNFWLMNKRSKLTDKLIRDY